MATFGDLSIDKAGTGYTLVATSDLLTSDPSNPFDITPGAASQLVFTTQPSNTTATDPITPPVEVTVEDAEGNAVTSFNGDITVAIGTNAGGTGILSGDTDVTAADGVATFDDLSIDVAADGYTLTASGDSLSGFTSGTFNIE